MKPIWIVDDDQSIRFVLEKALAREELAVRSFSAAARDGGADDRGAQSSSPTPHAGRLRHRTAAEDQGEPPAFAGHHHDRLLRPRQRVSAFQGGAFDYLPKPFDVPPRSSLSDVRSTKSARGGERPRRRADAEILGHGPRCRMFSGDRPAFAKRRHGADHGRIGSARSSSRTRCTSTARAPMVLRRD